MPLKESPLKEVPLKEVPLKEVPLKEVPLKEVPLKEVPLKEVPLKEVPLVVGAASLLATGRDAMLRVVAIAVRIKVFVFISQVLLLEMRLGVLSGVAHRFNNGERFS
ncbi:hypothetical protein NDI38_28870 [Stenomitos frigidus AS-A4]|uniref:Uncharacterized protein n=1 Tax=Stenomitos frigidus AS-A4 TaxID=2933935 RepID=A0ABV0KT18_9CYAN|nr:hypothetical protein [Phormidium sp. FACHB-592]